MPRKKEPSTEPPRKRRTGGFPTKRTPEYAARIIKALKVGATLEVASNYAGMSYHAFNEWRKADPKFNARVEKAQHHMEAESLRLIAAAGRKSWQARAWMLERLYPDRYAKRMVLGGGGAPIQIEGELTTARSIRESEAATNALHEAIEIAMAAAASTDVHTNGKAGSNGKH